MNTNNTESIGIDPLRVGHEALARGAWHEARTCFEAALRDEETAEALEGLGTAAWWLRDGAPTFDVRQRAYQTYRSRGDARGAARVASCLAIDHLCFRGEHAITNGWVQRGRQLLEVHTLAFKLGEGLEPGDGAPIAL